LPWSARNHRSQAACFPSTQSIPAITGLFSRRRAGFSSVSLEEKEIRRALLEMKASGIVKFYPDDSFKLDIIEPKLDLAVEFQRASIAIDKVIGEAPPFTYSLKEAASQIAEIVGDNKKRMVATLLQSVKAGYFVLNDSGKIASIADAFDQPQ